MRTRLERLGEVGVVDEIDWVRMGFVKETEWIFGDSPRHRSSTLEKSGFGIFIKLVDGKMGKTYGLWKGNQAFEINYNNSIQM